MSRVFIYALFLSLVWHALAFILFKLSEPYTRDRVQPHYFSVRLLPMSKNMQRRVMELNNYRDALSDYRLSLPYKSSSVIPVMPASLQVRQVSDATELIPKFTSSLIEHLPVFSTGDTLTDDSQFSANTDISRGMPLPMPVPATVVSASVVGKLDKELRFKIIGLEQTRKIVTKVFAKTSSTMKPIVVRFAVDISGNIRFVILEKSSGESILDKQFINALKQWRFTPRKVPVFTGNQELEWARIVFY